MTDLALGSKSGFLSAAKRPPRADTEKPSGGARDKTAPRNSTARIEVGATHWIHRTKTNSSRLNSSHAKPLSRAGSSCRRKSALCPSRPLKGGPSAIRYSRSIAAPRSAAGFLFRTVRRIWRRPFRSPRYSSGKGPEARSPFAFESGTAGGHRPRRTFAELDHDSRLVEKPRIM